MLDHAGSGPETAIGSLRSTKNAYLTTDSKAQQIWRTLLAVSGRPLGSLARYARGKSRGKKLENDLNMVADFRPWAYPGPPADSHSSRCGSSGRPAGFRLGVGLRASG